MARQPRQPKRYLKKAEKPKPPIPFILAYEDADGKVEEVTLSALGQPPLGYAKLMVDAFRRDGSGSRFIETGAGRIISVMGVLEVVLDAPSREKLDLLVKDPAVKVDFGILTEVWNDLTTIYASMTDEEDDLDEERPTLPSPSSSGGQPTTEPGSTDSASMPASVPSEPGSSLGD